MTSVSRRQHLQCRKANKYGKRVPKMLGGHKHHDQHPWSIMTNTPECSTKEATGKCPAARFSSRLLVYCVCFCSHCLLSVVLAFQGLFWIRTIKSGNSSNLSSKVNFLRRLEVITVSSTWKSVASRWEKGAQKCGIWPQLLCLCLLLLWWLSR